MFGLDGMLESVTGMDSGLTTPVNIEFITYGTRSITLLMTNLKYADGKYVDIKPERKGEDI